MHGIVLAAGRHVRPVDERAGRTGCVTWAVLPLDGPGHLVVALGARVTEVVAVLDQLTAVQTASRPYSPVRTRTTQSTGVIQ